MKKIAVLTDLMLDEVCSAKGYAERYIEWKVKGDTNWASRFKTMANDELRHAMIIHELAQKEIDELSSVFVPPQEMQEKWSECHTKYVEKAAWVKQMLEM